MDPAWNVRFAQGHQGQSVHGPGKGPSDTQWARRLGRRLGALLAARFAPWLIAAVAAGLVIHSVDNGLWTDDYVMLSQLRTPKTIGHLSRGPWDLFVFVPRDARGTNALVEEGVLPWWTDPGMRMAFSRPLASLTHALDAQLQPRSARAAHAQNILWFLAALGATALLYRVLLAPATATLALLFFALDDNHGPPVSAIACRNTLMGYALGTLALWAHVRWRRHSWRPGAWLAPLFLALGLLSSEVAIGACAYLFAYQAFVDAGTPRERARRLLSHGAVAILWAAAYVALRYGTVANAFYLDPVHEPWVFAKTAILRLPILLLAQLLGPSSDWWLVYPMVHPVLPYVVWTLALAALACMAAVARMQLRRDPIARFAACGMILSALPICAGVPGDRALALVGLGAMLLAAQIVSGYAVEAQGERRWFSALPVVAIVFVHVFEGAWLLHARAGASPLAAAWERANDSIPKRDVGDRAVVLVNAPQDVVSYQIAFMRDALGEARPRRLRVLAVGSSALAVTRVDDRSLRIRPEKGFFVDPTDTALRSARRPLALGSTVELSDVDATVDEMTPDGRPSDVLFRFRAKLDDPQFSWLQWVDRGYVSFPVPGIGETVRLSAVNLKRVFGGE